MPLNPRCLACGKNAPHFKFRPYCSEQCNPAKKTKTTKPKPTPPEGTQNEA